MIVHTDSDSFHWLIVHIHCVHKKQASNFLIVTFIWLLGPFYGAIAVPSVTRCCCFHRCGHWFYIAMACDSSDTWWIAM